MESDKIKGLDKLLKKFYGDDVEIVDKKLTYLTAPGENYLSDMLRLDVTIRNKNGAENIDHHVAKCVLEIPDLPPDLGVTTFRNEIAFYKEVIPAIQQFTKDQGIQDKDLFPKLIAARLNLEDSDKPDENAVIIMENLVTKGYKNFDRHKSFDLDGAKFLLSDLATFHAVPVAMKILNFELFQKKIVDNCKGPPPHPPKEHGDKEKMKPPNPISLLRLIAKEDPFCRNHITKLEELVKQSDEEMRKRFRGEPDYSSPFMTLSHNDMWLNNTMQLTNKDEQIIKSKFVDFQMCSIGEPTLDLIFFLFSSVDIPTLENHFDYLLMFYHECFIKTLEKYKCDVSPYAYDKFMKKAHDAVIKTFFQIMIMSFRAIYGKKGEKSDFLNYDNLKPSDVHPIAKNKFLLLFRMIIENDWF